MAPASSRTSREDRGGAHHVAVGEPADVLDLVDQAAGSKARWAAPRPSDRCRRPAR